ncbi:hypothetical protein Tco_0998196, partial [Tanacetum coccineum]
MSSPNHPTFEIKDAFSSNFSDYIPTSPDYVPTSPRKTYSSSSNNSFGVVPIVSPTLLLFIDDPYMKVMHAYYAKESLICNGYQEKDKTKAKPNETEHEIRKSTEKRVQRRTKVMGRQIESCHVAGDTLSQFILFVVKVIDEDD